MSKIKAVVFDFGNVIAKVDADIFLERIKGLTSKSKSEISDFIYGSSDLIKRSETGLISTVEFCEEIMEFCDLNVSEEEFICLFTKDKLTVIEGMFDLIRSLKKNYKLAVLSNTKDIDYSNGLGIFPEKELFDEIVLSHEIKVMKPDKKIYLETIKRLDVLPKESIYIDDIFDYVEAARNLEMKAIQYKDIDQLKADLKKLNVNI